LEVIKEIDPISNIFTAVTKRLTKVAKSLHAEDSFENPL
jgi:hypothetical protein